MGVGSPGNGNGMLAAGITDGPGAESGSRTGFPVAGRWKAAQPFNRAVEAGRTVSIDSFSMITRAFRNLQGLDNAHFPLVPGTLGSLAMLTLLFAGRPEAGDGLVAS